MNQAFATTPVRAAILLLALGLGACSSIDSLSSGDKIDYGQAARKTNPLEVPPDLTALNRDTRYLPQSGAVSASQLQQQAATRPAAATQAVAPQALEGMRIERDGQTRWLVSPLTPEQLYPKVRQFWLDKGFALTTDSPETGLIETDWAENRAKIPGDLIRNTIGKVFDALYSTGERDRYRTRLERGPKGTEVVISHRGLEEVLVSKERDGSTIWTRRPTDPQLEAEMLSRLMLALGASDSAARTALQAAPTAAPVAAAASGAAGGKASELQGAGTAALMLSEPIDRAWRRVGLALDRTGFTVEDRDRIQQLYFVRYADPKSAGNEEPGFFAKLFSGDKGTPPLARFRVALKPVSPSATQVQVLNDQGAPDNSAGAQSIIKLLLPELQQ